MNNLSYRFIFYLILWVSFQSSATAQTEKKPNKKTVEFGNNPQAGKYVKTRGFNMYYETYGKGEPLVLIHGNGGSISSFYNQIPYFSKYYKVIAVDSRAQGKSIDLNDSLSFEMMADDFNALLDSLHLKSCNVIGWSDGGINGLLLVMRHPDKVKKLAVTGANLWPDSTALSPSLYKESLQWNDSIIKFRKNKVLTAEEKNQYKLFELDFYQPHITRQQLSTIKCPTLVMGGDHDLILPKHTLYIAESIPNAFLWILPNSDHGTLITHKDKFNQTVYEFFKLP